MSVTNLVALLLLQAPDPQAVMKAYWDKLGKAKTLHAVLKTGGAHAPTEMNEVWLEKPGRIRIVMKGAEVRSDGKKIWIINSEAKTYHYMAPTGEDTPLPFEPFFGQKRFDRPELGWYSDNLLMTRSLPPRHQAVVLRKKDDKAGDWHIFIDPTTSLPLGSEMSNDMGTYSGHCLAIQLDDPKISFAWPPLKGYTEIK